MPQNLIPTIGYSTIFQDPTDQHLFGIARKEGDSEFFQVFRGELKERPDFDNVPSENLAEQLIMAGTYEEALAIYQAAMGA